MLPSFQLDRSPEEFLQEFWQQRPLVFRNAASGLADLLSPDELAGLALEPNIESRLIQGVGQGPWQVIDGPLDEHLFSSLPEQNWTLLVQSVDHYLTEASLLLDSFRFLPAWRLEDIMVSYAVPGGSVGPHYDQYDVFLIQASGQRNWKTGPHCNSDTPLQQHDQLRLLKQMPVEQEYLLNPGDVLYLPPGVAHWGGAVDDQCVTWSVGFRAPGRADLLAHIVDTTLSNADCEQLISGAQRTACQHHGVLSPEDIDYMYQTALSTIQSADISRAVASFFSEPRQDSLDFAVDTGTIRALDPQARMVRHGGARCLVTEPDSTGYNNHGSLWINGQAISISPDCMDLARYIASNRIYYKGRQELESPSPEHSALIEKLIARGVLCPL